MSESLHLLLKELSELSKKSEYNSARFFKQDAGGYAQHDQFLGLRVPDLRSLVKKFKDLKDEDILELLRSKYNEYRLLALFFLVDRYEKGDLSVKNKVYNLYLQNIEHVNNWNLVDASAHLIIGAHVGQNLAAEDIIYQFVDSKKLWLERIAMVATWHHIRQKRFDIPLQIAEKLLKHQHDLIHKAVGWMLREIGKKDKNLLLLFLHKHVAHMPRTTLRYAIEHFDDVSRKKFLKMK